MKVSVLNTVDTSHEDMIVSNEQLIWSTALLASEKNSEFSAISALPP